ncbi:MAG: tail fiber domain-containing protein, partial [Candidatus Fonsibacter sp.]
MSAGSITTSGTVSAGSITSSGNIMCATGTMNGRTITCTGNTGSYITTPTAVGAYLQNTVISNSGYAWMELCRSNSGMGYIDFTTVNADARGRFSYALSSNQYEWSVYNGTAIASKMILNSSGLSVGGTFVSASDKRLKFNEKPLSNALDVINRLEPVEYDQTHDMVDQYTADTPQSHQCGFIAQSVQAIDELKHAVVGGQVGDDGKESIRALNYNAIFTYAVKAVQEL